MIYSLSRYRIENPRPPFSVGGLYHFQNGQATIGDALGSFQLEGLTSAQMADVGVGDLVQVEVTGVEGLRLLVANVRLIHRGQQCTISFGELRPHAPRFLAFVDRVRQFFLEEGLSELQTPTLVPCPGMEPSLEAFSLQVSKGRRERRLYLPTSPEIHLKKAMALGFHDVFEIKTCFRRGEFSEHHENEFTMLEWYRGFADLDLIVTDLVLLLEVLSAAGWGDGEAPNAHSVEPSTLQFTTTDFQHLFRQFLKFELTPKTTVTELRLLCQSLSLYYTQDDSFDDLFHRLLIDRLEPEMAKLGPLIVRRFPPSQAALAKLDQEGWADRFEFYWKGLEIANAFNEVTDPKEQIHRWQLELTERLRLGTEPLTPDPGLIQALEKGIPPSGGIALGLERLYMAFTNVKDIKDLRLFSTEDQFR